MRPIVSVLAVVVLVSVLSLLGGCTYVCHRYDGFEASVSNTDWKIEGRVTREHAEGRAPTKYSLPHWGARDDDRYSLRLVPVAPDSTFWDEGFVEVVGVRIIADKDTVNLRWAEKEPTYDMVVSERKILHSARGYFRNTPYSDWYEEFGRDRAFRKITFISEYFQVYKPVPDVLTIEYELLVFDGTTSEPTSRWKLVSKAVVDRHRRWVIIDAIES